MSNLLRIKAVHAFGLAGKHVPAGETVEAPAVIANDLIARGRAIPVRADAPAKPPAKPQKAPETTAPNADGQATGEEDDGGDESDPSADAAKKGKGGKKSSK